MTDDRHEDRIDFSALDPTLPPAAFARQLATARENARFGLARRRHEAGALVEVTRWQSPLIAAMVALMIISAVVFRSATGEAGLTVTPADEVAESLGIASTAGDSLLGPDASSVDAILRGGNQ
jgi:hypothetical protein